jgi:hypothetical protein
MTPSATTDRDAARLALSCDIAFWPAALRAHSTPILEERHVPCEELALFCASAAPKPLGWRSNKLGQATFPKLATASWKEWPWTAPHYGECDLSLLRSPRMIAVLAPWIALEQDAILRFFEFRDYRAVNEYRFALPSGALQRKLLREDHKGEHAAQELLALARSTTTPELVVDIATKRSASGVEAWFVELNPFNRIRGVSQTVA